MNILSMNLEMAISLVIILTSRIIEDQIFMVD